MNFMNFMNSPSLDALGSIFTDTLADVIAKVSGFSLSVISSEPDSNFSDIAGLINMLDKNGKNGVMFFVSANEADMRVICSYMTGVPKEDVTKEDAADALCEIVNMTAGNVKLRLGGDYTFMPSTPLVVRGENISLLIKKRTAVISKYLGNGEISIKMKVIVNLN